MLKKEAQEKLLKSLKFSDADIAKVMADGEFDIDVPATIHIFTDPDLNTLKDNVKRGANESAIEVYAKKLKTDFGIVSDSKDIAELMKVYTAVEVAKVGTPDVKVKELEDSIKNLRTTIVEKETEANNWKAKLSEREINDEYRLLLDVNRNPALDDAEWIERLKRNYEFVEDNGVRGLKDKATGKVIKDNKEAIIPAVTVISEKFKSTPEWIKTITSTDIDPLKKKTHNPGTPGGGGGKYMKDGKIDQQAIMKEVDSKYPKETTEKNAAKLRKEMFTDLMNKAAADN